MERRARDDTSNPTDYYLVDCARWIGYYATDCSGIAEWFLLKAGIQVNCDTNASGMYNRWCIEQGSDMDEMPKIPGTAVFKRTASGIVHMGIYVGNDRIIEAKGAAYGTLVTKFSADPGWNLWGIFDWLVMDVAENPNATPLPVMTIAQQLPGYPSLNNSVTEGVTHNRGSAGKIYKRGSKGDEVTQIQRRLWAVDSTVGVDGEFGPSTETAVIAFQTRHSLTADGIVGEKTWDKMFPVAKRSGSNSAETVQAIKALLAFRGFQVSGSGSSFDLETENRIKEFQTSAGLTADGIMGALSWAAITSNEGQVNGKNTGKEWEDILTGASILVIDPITVCGAARTAQQILKKLGYNVSVTGKFDNSTAQQLTNYWNNYQASTQTMSVGIQPMSLLTVTMVSELTSREANALESDGGTGSPVGRYYTVDDIVSGGHYLKTGNGVRANEATFLLQAMLILDGKLSNTDSNFDGHYGPSTHSAVKSLLNDAINYYTNASMGLSAQELIKYKPELDKTGYLVGEMYHALMSYVAAKKKVNSQTTLNLVNSNLHTIKKDMGDAGYGHLFNSESTSGWSYRFFFTTFIIQAQAGLSKDGLFGDNVWNTLRAIKSSPNSKLGIARFGGLEDEQTGDEYKKLGFTPQAAVARIIFSEDSALANTKGRQGIGQILYNRRKAIESGYPSYGTATWRGIIYFCKSSSGDKANFTSAYKGLRGYCIPQILSGTSVYAPWDEVCRVARALSPNDIDAEFPSSVPASAIPTDVANTIQLRTEYRASTVEIQSSMDNPVTIGGSVFFYEPQVKPYLD